MPRETKEWHGKNDDHVPPPSVKRRIKSRANDCCEACGIRVRYRGQIDHTVALINGGENREANLRFLCANCHGSKTKHDVAQKAADHKTQIHLAGFRPKCRRLPPKRERVGLMERISWIDELGRDRVTWLKHQEEET